MTLIQKESQLAGPLQNNPDIIIPNTVAAKLKQLLLDTKQEQAKDKELDLRSLLLELKRDLEDIKARMRNQNQDSNGNFVNWQKTQFGTAAQTWKYFLVSQQVSAPIQFLF